MKKVNFAAATIVALSAATPASAASFIITPGAPATTVASNNNFSSDLAGLGYIFQSIGATVSLSGPARIIFDILGTESRFDDSFSVPGLSTFTETVRFRNWFDDPLEIGSVDVGSGPLDVLFSSAGAGSRTAAFGDAGLAVFIKTPIVNSIATPEIFFAFDDTLGIDDDFDDLLVRARIAVVPEPATWAMMIGGFGLVGAAARKRKRALAAA